MGKIKLQVNDEPAAPIPVRINLHTEEDGCVVVQLDGIGILRFSLESLALWVDAGLKDWFRRECERKGITLTMGLHRLLSREQRRVEGRRKR